MLRIAEEASQPSDDGIGEEDLEEEEAPPFYKRPRFWRMAIPIAITLSATTVGLLLTFIPSWHFYTTVRVAFCPSLKTLFYIYALTALPWHTACFL